MSVDSAPPRLAYKSEIPELRSALEEFAASTGYRYYTYICGKVIAGRRVTNFDPREKPFHLTNVPHDWERHYSGNRYYDHDPMMLFALYNLLPERWSNVIRRRGLTARQEKIVKEAAEAGMRDGIIVPVHGPGGEFAVFSLSHDQTDKQARSNVETDEALLHLFALRFHAIARNLRGPVEQEPPTDLTSREIDVLFWTAEGKSTWDISQILSISEATVNFHINSAKRKLGVYSKSHAVAKMFSFNERQII